MTPSSSGQPIALTVNPKLDAALAEGHAAWDAAARAAGVGAVAGWLAQRLGDAGLKRELLAPVRSFLEAEDDEDVALARAELAEIVESGDDALADALWEGVLAYGRDAGDADTLLEALTHLAAIAEAHADPLAAAEYFLEFLNWRREPGHASDPESVEVAFDEIIRLAERDGDPKAAAIYQFRQAAFTRLLEADDPRAEEGDWESDPAPYQSWM